MQPPCTRMIDTRTRLLAQNTSLMIIKCGILLPFFVMCHKTFCIAGSWSLALRPTPNMPQMYSLGLRPGLLADHDIVSVAFGC